ncbi:MAG: lysophospholipid acyltransferase family protein [Pseudomonadota bacterium]
MTNAIGSPSSNPIGAPDASDRAGFGGGDPGWNSATWSGAEPAPNPPKTPFDQIRGALRLLAFAATTLALLPVFFLMRALDQLFGGRRDRAIAALWCGAGMAISGLRARRLGAPLPGGGVILANHASWLDVMVLGWLAPVHFVAKAEVATWPLFGWIGKISNTVFIERRRTEAKAQERMLARRARDGDLLCVFPEGTSSDGLRVLPFKTSLFALFFSDETASHVLAQPVSVHYAPRAGLPASFYGFWGRMPLSRHLWDVVCLSRGGVATVIFHAPVDPADFDGRKALANATEARVAAGLQEAAGDPEREAEPETTDAEVAPR